LNSATDIETVIHKTVKDLNRRKSNVIVTGIPELTSSDTSDRELFTNFCEENLAIKPALSNLGCKRLGRSPDQQGRPRRLLVHLNSESTAADLLMAAKQLRRSDDPSVKSVYINPDLAPAEAKIAFESRQRRRELLSKRATVNDGGNSRNITPKGTPAITHIVDGVNDNGVHVAGTAPVVMIQMLLSGEVV